MAGVGTLAWGRRGGGRLSLADRLALLGQAVALQFDAWARRRGAGPSPAAVDLAARRPPDTAVARRAEAWCREASPPFLVNHCLRAFAWGRLIAAHDRVAFDEEALYVACLLHDLGLTERGAPVAPVVCFGVSGGEAARAALLGAGWPVERVDLVAEAICLHLNVRVSLRHGPIAYLVRAASALDVIGARRGALPPAAVEAVLAAHPRLGFKREMEAAARRYGLRPGSRLEFLFRRFGFGRLIAAAPFGE
jgi:hypothetical protein